MLALLTLAVVLFRHAVTTFFAVDDFVFLEWAATRGWPPTLVQVYEQRFLSGQAAFSVSMALFGLRPEPPHALVFGLHAFNAWLAYRLLARLLPHAPGIAVVAGGLFLLHPVAFTPIAWLAAGFNEIPTLTLTLLATHLAVRFVEDRSWLNGLGAILLPFAAAGFKEHAVVAPAYIVTVAAFCGFRNSRSRSRRLLLIRLSLLAIAFVAGLALFVHFVLPGATQKFSGPYERVLTLPSLTRTYTLLLWNSLNPLAFLRPEIGYQLAIPRSLAHWQFEISVAGVTILGLAIISASTMLRVRMTALLLFVVLIATLAIPATMPGHVYDYYSYFSLPAATGLVAVVLVTIVRAVGLRFHPFLGLAIGPVCLAYAVLAGGELHRANGLVRQAANARAIDQLIENVSQSQVVYFVPPITPAVDDAVSGLSVTTLHREKQIKVEFASQGDVPDRFAQDSSVTLVGLDELDDRGWRVYRFDKAQWKTDLSVPLFFDREFIQRVQPREDDLHEIQVLIVAPTPPCRFHYAVDRLGAAGDHERELIAEGDVPCPASSAPRHVALEIPHQDRSAGAIYQFRLRMIGDQSTQSAVRVFGSKGVPAGMFPVLLGGDQATEYASTMAHRLVVQSDWTEPGVNGYSLLFIAIRYF